MIRRWALIAPEGFRAETERELRHLGLAPDFSEGDFFLFSGEPRSVAWSAVVWLDVKELRFSSINEAAKKLKKEARLHEHYPLRHRGRGKLIHEQLRPLRSLEIDFPMPLLQVEGASAFTLLEEGVALFCRSFDRPHPLGRVAFREDKDSAPSRAYLKLWEALCRMGEWPKAGELTVDLGACPGGWTWVLASLGAEVIAVDRAPLDPRVASMKGVSFRKGDAFRFRPSEGPVDWLCSDVICAPEKLLELVREWVASGQARHFVCTLKFQGEADPVVVEAFRELGTVEHLFHNKHELTFMR